MSDEEYLLMAKVCREENNDDLENAVMDLELIDHMMALHKTRHLLGTRTLKGNLRKNGKFSQQIDSLINNDIQERVALGLIK